MRRHWLGDLGYYIFGPVVLLLALIAFFLALFAAYENYRVGRATSDMITIISMVKDMRIPPTASPERASSYFFDYVKQAKAFEIQQLSSSFLGHGAEMAVKNAWGKPTLIDFNPSGRVFRIETTVNVVACRKILMTFAPDLKALGVRRIEVKEDDPTRIWRLLYDDPTGRLAKDLSQDVVWSGCGQGTQNVVALTIGL